jgi:iron complex transport system substrate-binding protein
MWQEIRILGEIFDKEQDADELIDNLDSKIKLVNGRTKDIPESDKPEVLLFGTPNWVLGKQIIQSYFLENIVHANNVAGEGTWSIISAEQMLALNPDVIIVMAHADYVSLEEVYAGEDTGFNWKLVQEAKAIKEHSVCSLGDPEWRAESLEGIIGTLRMAKTIYPEKFEDIDPDKEEIKLYKELYGLTDEEVEKAVAAQRPKKK